MPPTRSPVERLRGKFKGEIARQNSNNNAVIQTNKEGTSGKITKPTKSGGHQPRGGDSQSNVNNDGRSRESDEERFRALGGTATTTRNRNNENDAADDGGKVDGVDNSRPDSFDNSRPNSVDSLDLLTDAAASMTLEEDEGVGGGRSMGSKSANYHGEGEALITVSVSRGDSSNNEEEERQNEEDEEDGNEEEQEEDEEKLSYESSSDVIDGNSTCAVVEDDDDAADDDASGGVDGPPSVAHAVIGDWPKASVDANYIEADAAIIDVSRSASENPPSHRRERERGGGEVAWGEKSGDAVGESMLLPTIKPPSSLPSNTTQEEYDAIFDADSKKSLLDSNDSPGNSKLPSAGGSDVRPSQSALQRGNNPQLEPSQGCQCTLVSNCGECRGQSALRCSRASAPPPSTVNASPLSTPSRALSLSTPGYFRASGMSAHLRERDGRMRDSGDSHVSTDLLSVTSESMAGHMDQLCECTCMTPLLIRIRNLQESVRDHIETNKKCQADKEAANDLCRRLREQLSEWSQATSFFDDEKIQLASKVHKAIYERDQAVENVKSKEQQLAAMKTRLQSREGDFKTEVENLEKVKLDLTHAEARMRQAEEWAETAKRKADEDRKARKAADERRAAAIQRVEELEMELIEVRRLHATDHTLLRLREEKNAVEIQLKTAHEEIRSLSTEYKRLLESKNGKPRFQDYADRVTELLKKNGELENQLGQLRCQANGQINDLHKDKNNVNAELHRVKRELAQSKPAQTDLKAANAMLKQELGVLKRDAGDLRTKLEEETKRNKEESFKQKLFIDKMTDLLTRARQEIIALKAKMAGVMGRADHLQELASKRARDLVEVQSENERKLLECQGSMIHSTEELHGQIELLRVALLKKAEELQTLKEIHENCPGAGPVNLRPITVRLGPDGKYESVPLPPEPPKPEPQCDKCFTQEEMDQVIDMLENKLYAMKSDNDRLKEIIKDYDCCCADRAIEQNGALQKSLVDSQLERQHLRQMAQNLLQTKNFLSSGLHAAIEERFGAARDDISDAFIERINGVRRICRHYELDEVRRRLQELGVPLSLVDEVIDEAEEEDDGDGLLIVQNADEHLNDLFDMFSMSMGSENSEERICRLSKELEHYKEMEQKLNETKDVEYGLAKTVVRMIKADVIESLDAPLEDLSEFKTFLWEHESAFDERAFKSNRDLTAAIREELAKEAGELHEMLQKLKHKLLDLRGSGALGSRRGEEESETEIDERRRKSDLLKRLANNSLTDSERNQAMKELGLHSDSELQKILQEKRETEEMRRKSELLKQLADENLSEEEKQKALEELGLEHLSDRALTSLIKDEQERLSKENKEIRRRSELLRMLAEGNLSEEERLKVLEELGLEHLSEGALMDWLKDQADQMKKLAEEKVSDLASGIKTIYDDMPSRSSGVKRYIDDLLQHDSLDSETKKQLQRMLEEGASDEDVQKRLAKLRKEQVAADSYVEGEAKKMAKELMRRWRNGDITEDEVVDLQQMLAAPMMSYDEKLLLKKKLTDGSLTTKERKNVLTALRDEDREELRQILSGINPRAAKRAPKMTEEAKLTALSHDNGMTDEQRRELHSKIDAIKNDETLSEEQTRKQLQGLVEDHIREARRRSIESIENKTSFSEEEKQAKIKTLVDNHLENSRARALENVRNDDTLSQEEKQRRIEAMHKTREEARGSLDLVHKEGSLTSVERARLQTRLDEDWVLTGDEREKIGARLLADNERGKLVKRMSPVDDSIIASRTVDLEESINETEIPTFMLTPNDTVEGGEFEVNVEGVGSEIESTDVESRHDAFEVIDHVESREGRLEGGGGYETEEKDERQEGSYERQEGIPPSHELHGERDERLEGSYERHGERDERLEGSCERHGGRDERLEGSYERHEGRHGRRQERGGGRKEGRLWNSIGYFNQLAGILPDPSDQVCVCVCRDRDDDGDHLDQNANNERRKKLDRELQALESHAVVQRLKRQRREREKHDRRATDEKKSARRDRERTVEERIARLRRQILSQSDSGRSDRPSAETLPPKRK